MRYLNSVTNYMERMTFHQVALLSVVAVVLGFFLLLGFGSRIKD